MQPRTAKDVVLDTVERLADMFGGSDERVPQYRIIFACQRAGLDRETVEHTLAELFAAGVLARVEVIETESYVTRVPFEEYEPFSGREYVRECHTSKIYYAFPDFD